MINTNIGYIICESFTEPEKPKIKMINGKAVGQGVLQRANEKNRNGRWYSREELFPQLTAPRTLELLNAGYLRAEVGHPRDTSLQRQSVIDDNNTCAKFLKLWTEGDLVCAEFVGTNNEKGRTFNDDLLEGCLPAWSLRALGSINQTRNGAEVKNLRLITWDQVIYPSHPGAYTRGLVMESTNSGIVVPKLTIDYDSVNEQSITPITDDKVIKYIQNESANLKFIRECFDFRYTGIHINEAGTRVMLSTNTGETIAVNMESYVHNELMNYAVETAKFREI